MGDPRRQHQQRSDFEGVIEVANSVPPGLIPVEKFVLAQGRPDTGTTLYAANRIISHWEGMGAVECGRERVLILQPDRLEAMAEDPPPPKNDHRVITVRLVVPLGRRPDRPPAPGPVRVNTL
jgi:hypothetical protein